MDAAGNRDLNEVVAEQSRAVELVQQQLNQLGTAFNSLTERLEALFSNQPANPVQQVVNPPAQPPPVPEPQPPALTPLKVALPEKYHGDPEVCEGFLLQCDIYFAQQPPPGPNDNAKIMFVTSLLSGKALKWATALWSQNPAMNESYELFASTFRTVFGSPKGGREVGEQLLELRQGRNTVADYALTFRTLAAQSGWNEASLITAFRRGLSEVIQTELACRDDALSLNDLIKMATRLDVLLQSRRHTSRAQRGHALPQIVSAEEGEPMQLGHTRLSQAERQRRIEGGLCLYCGNGGHMRSGCPNRPLSRPGNTTQRTSSDSCADAVSMPDPLISIKMLTVPVTVHYLNQIFSFAALVDSGAAGNFIEEAVAEKLKIPAIKLDTPLRIQAINYQPIGEGTVTHITEPVTITIGSVHSEQISFHVLRVSSHPIVLGLPWLLKHNPKISWEDRDIVQWSSNCFENCIKLTLASTSIESPLEPSLTDIPDVYSDLLDVFSKIRASELPPHRPWDCSIELEEGKIPPRARIYPLSVKETQAMEDYIQEALNQGFIRPSTSPASASMFFVEKKDGGLRPCVDYRGLNEITKKFRYPLPLVPAALEQLRGARYFTKLDLRSAYNLIRIKEGDEWKTAFSTNSGHYEYLVMSYGLVNAPSVFQSFINEVLRDMLGKYVIAFLDDILIYSASLPEHVQQVRQVLQRLLQNRLYVKAEKCQFHQTHISFLGYLINREGVHMDEKKVEAVTGWKKPGQVDKMGPHLSGYGSSRHSPHLSSAGRTVLVASDGAGNTRIHSVLFPVCSYQVSQITAGRLPTTIVPLECREDRRSCC
uniref:ribonuclease H n=1 Tax=Astyanax mexicanus TaxID=7994 RepID=A0A3B1KLG0_ASTMX